MAGRIDTPVRLAVASKDGIAISEHFGHAKQFRIYEIDAGHCQLLEERVVEYYCLGNHSSKTAMATIIEAIRDCHAVFVAKIGDGPTDKLRAAGIKAISRYAWEEIEPALLDYVKSLQETE